MDYYFNYLNLYSKFYDEILPKESKIYIDASYLYNFQSACYNLISKKDHRYFIDPATYKFQYGGDRAFYLNYLNYFEELEDLFNNENIINLEFLEDLDNFNDFYKKIIRFQRTILAKTNIPIDYYWAIANGIKDVKSFNPIENLKFLISPYFQFNKMEDAYYNYTLKYSLVDPENYCVLRFPKEILIDTENIEKIAQDFKKSTGILINILELNQYYKNDLNFYFENLIDLIYRFFSNNQKVILMNNSEFGKYFKYFGLEAVCSNVMIGQTTLDYKPFKSEKKGGSTDFIYIPQIEKSVSITNGEILINRNKELRDLFPENIRILDLNSRVDNYFISIKKKIEKINQSPFQKIIQELEDIFSQITFDLHKKDYEYINIWKEILLKKFNEHFSS